MDFKKKTEELIRGQLRFAVIADSSNLVEQALKEAYRDGRNESLVKIDNIIGVPLDEAIVALLEYKRNVLKYKRMKEIKK